ncbi:hypothetical protein [Nakamurella leprariae]|uniref:hypothetical protein n=1 Tax=Nakamurella leprariae TaxID=2803911 RepID=UPI001F37B224|nr:hypothetical protein [Nakamurella leprariae]
MFYLNTSRQLLRPADEATLAALRSRIDGIADTAGTLGGIRSIAWLVSLDRMRMEAFSAFDTAAGWTAGSWSSPAALRAWAGRTRGDWPARERGWRSPTWTPTGRPPPPPSWGTRRWPPSPT